MNRFVYRMVVMMVVGALAVAWGRPAWAAPEPRLDSDGDGVPDSIEDSNRDGVVQPGETDPHHADSDRDGLPDGFEDENRDGRVNVGETDPTILDTDRDGVGDGMEVIVTGTDPNVADIGPLEARFSMLPEPLFFDLVRGLASRRGELEVNSLFSGHPGGRLHWAPEIEYAVADGMAFELELPMVDAHLEALKVAGQTRLPLPANEMFIHGMQGIVETALSDGSTDLTLLWLVAAAPNRKVSFLGMFGTRLPVDRHGAGTPDLVANPAIFRRLSPRLTVGAEANGVLHPDRRHAIRLLPQLHWEPIDHVRIQLGAGLEATRGEAHPSLATRLVIEL